MDIDIDDKPNFGDNSNMGPEQVGSVSLDMNVDESTAVNVEKVEGTAVDHLPKEMDEMKLRDDLALCQEGKVCLFYCLLVVILL